MCSICYDIVIPGAAQTDEGRVHARILLVEVDISHGEEGLLPGLVQKEHTLGATSIVKIGEVRLSGEIGGA